jgi:NADH-quinone oxidoreductase subunit L
MFRLYATTFRGSFRGTQEQEHHLHESPSAITVPLIVLAILSVIGGYVDVPEFIVHGVQYLEDFLAPVFSPSKAILKTNEVTHQTEWMLTGISAALTIVMVIYAWSRYSRKPDMGDAKGFGKLLQHKWYVDELYEKIIVRPLNALGSFLSEVFEKTIVDGMVNGVGRLVNYGSRQLRLLQSGQVGSYVLLMVVGMLLFFVFQFFLRK